MPDIPTLATERLILRPHRLADFEASCALWSDPDVVRHIGGVPFTREQCWTRLMRYAGLWHHLGFGYLAVEEKESGRFIGEAGFQEARRSMTPSIEGTLEAGWVFSPTAHGRGYATEAMTALVGWATEAFPALPLTCIIVPENRASLNVAAKLGFREKVTTTYGGIPTVLLERQASGGGA